MQKIDRLGWADGICFTSYGLRIGIRVNDPAVLERLGDHLPPGWKPAPSPIVDRLYSLRVGGAGPSANIRRFNMLYVGAGRLARTSEIEELFEPLENDLQMFVAEWARRRVFVHAGVVGWKGKAILIPGRSFSGKTTLTTALVRAGATYYSDEYAVLDDQGRVYPFPRRLSIRKEDGSPFYRCSPEELGCRIGTSPLPVGMVVVTHYEPGAHWRPRRLSPGRAALALLDNTAPARRRPTDVLATLHQVVAHAPTLKGVRGPAEATVETLLERLGR
jgi:hypothetical protein